MKAAICYELNSPLKIEEVNLAEPQQGEVLVKLAATGVCHSDLHFMKGAIPTPLPVVPGHEGAGIVEAVGPGVTSLQPGDHVIMMVTFSCGVCSYCNEGHPTMCVENLIIQMGGTLPFGSIRLKKGDQPLHHLFGLACFSEKVVVNERSCVKVRDDAPLDKVCILGCAVTTGLGAAINTGHIRPGQSVVVWGVGGVGLSAVMGAKTAGAGKIIAVDLSQSNLDMAKELGADHTINPTETDDPVMKVKELTGGTGADVAIEAAGVAALIQQAFGSIRSGGKCVVAGMAPMTDTVTFMPFEFLLGKTITGTSQGDIVPSRDIPRFVDMYMEGKLPIDKLITQTFELDRINDAFTALENKEVIKSIIKI